MRASVVIETSEWNPAHRIQLREVLERVSRQAREVSEAEIVLVLASSHAPNRIELAEMFPWVKLVQAPEGHNYYSHKNLGAKHAQCDIVVLLDANCRPEEGWLRNTLACFTQKNGAIAAVQGKTRYDRGRLSRFWDLVWWAWSLRVEGEIPRLYTSNNMAFRAQVLIENPFDLTWPYHTGLERDHGAALRESGHRLWYCPSMVASHNYAEGVRSFILMSMVWGYFFWEGRRRQRNRLDRLVRRAGLLSPLLFPPAVWLRSTWLLVAHWRGLGFLWNEIWKFPGLVALLVIFAVIMPIGMAWAIAGGPPFPRPS